MASAGRWVDIAYESSWFDPCCRPVLRFEGQGDAVQLPLPAAPFGRGRAVVHVPQGTRTASIRPVHDGGPFGFRLTRWRPLTRREVLARALANDPRTALESIGARLFGGPRECRHILRAALAGTPLAHFEAWHANAQRPLDLGGLDRPRFDWTTGPLLSLLLPTEDRDRLPEVTATLARQPYPRWQVGVADPLARLADKDFLGLLPPGTELEPHALAVLAEAAHRHPGAVVLFSDERITGTGGPMRLRGDWHPLDGWRLAWGEALLFVRADALRAAKLRQVENWSGVPVGDLVPGLQPGQVVHVRRLLMARPRPTPRAVTTPVITSVACSIAVVIPSRDRADLLGPCLEGLLTGTSAPGLRAVVVDNGSRQRRTRLLYRRWRGDRRLRVLERPGAFNYSALCNDGAAAGTADVLVFLNNDVEVIEPGWLAPLVAWSLRPDVGAVGARLLYPDGRLQHDGVLLGVGGFAGHVHENRPRAGWDVDDDEPRRVSAVTGACLVVERRKFEAVGGFDAAAFPVDLSDVDLCLRLADRGWSSVLVPRSRLVHRESASRGDAWKPFTTYGRERSAFLQRWGERLHDDPGFHPALSLWSRQLRLG